MSKECIYFLGHSVYVCVCVFPLLSLLCNFYSSPDYEGNTVHRNMGNYASTSRYVVKSDEIHHHHHQDHGCEK